MLKYFKSSITGSLAVIAGLIGFSIWYLNDAYTASSSLDNLIFIGPLSTIVILLLLIELIIILKKGPQKPDLTNEKKKDDFVIFKGMFVFAVFIFIMDKVGFDLATAFFVSAFMFVTGERRIWMLAGYSIVFAVVVTAFFSMMLPYPMETLIPFE